MGEVVFSLVKNAKSADFPKGHCKIAWDRLVSKYALHAALSLLKLKSEFHNSKLESMEKYHDECILHVEVLSFQMNKFGQKGSMSDKDILIHILNSLLKDNNLILDGHEHYLMIVGDNVLTREVIQKN